MPDTLAATTHPGAVRLERTLPGPIERVWAYLTDDGLRATWLAGGPMEGRVGGAVTLRFRHADLSDEVEAVPERYRAMAESGHEMHGVVTAWDPPHLLRYTWDGEEEASEVTFELHPEGDEVRLVVTQRRLDGRAALVSVAGGWHAHVAILRDRLEGREPPGFWGLHSNAEREYAEAFAAVPERVAPDGAGALTAAPDGRPRLRFVRELAAPIAATWRGLTEPALLDRWYPATLRMEGRVGGWVREAFEGEEPLPDGTLLEIEPPRRLAWEAQGDPGSEHAGVRHPQRLAFELEEGERGSSLTFEHTFGDRAMTASFAAGWHTCLELFAGVVEGRDATPDDAALREAYRAWFEGAA